MLARIDRVDQGERCEKESMKKCVKLLFSYVKNTTRHDVNILTQVVNHSHPASQHDGGNAEHGVGREDKQHINQSGVYFLVVCKLVDRGII